MRKLKVILWAPFGAGDHYWGPGTSAFRLFKNNDQKYLEVTLIHASEEQGLYPEVYKEQIKLPSFRSGTYLDLLWYFIAARKWINRNHHKYDVVYGISAFEYTFRPMIHFATLGKPVFIKLTSEHGGFGNNSRLSRILGISRGRIKHANKLSGYISISSNITANLIENGISENKIFEISNGVNQKRFCPPSIIDKIELRASNNLKNVITFIYVGGLTFNKRIIDVVQAIVELKSVGIYDFQFLIVGPDRSGGKVETELDNLLMNSNLGEAVIRVNHTEKPEMYLQMGDVFILASITEGMSNSLLEAMSCGLAVIATPISGSVDLINDGFNGLFCNGSVQDIKKQIVRYIEDQSLVGEFGKRNRDIIEKKYTDKRVLLKHIELFLKHVK